MDSWAVVGSWVLLIYTLAYVGAAFGVHRRFIGRRARGSQGRPAEPFNLAVMMAEYKLDPEMLEANARNKAKTDRQEDYPPLPNGKIRPYSLWAEMTPLTDALPLTFSNGCILTDWTCYCNRCREPVVPNHARGKWTTVNEGYEVRALTYCQTCSVFTSGLHLVMPIDGGFSIGGPKAGVWVEPWPELQYAPLAQCVEEVKRIKRGG